MTINIGLLDEESVVEAIEIVDELAAENGIDWALVGGLAMALCGSDRTTKDIDIIADKLLPLEKVGDLMQGGERYLIKTGKKEVAVEGLSFRADVENIENKKNLLDSDLSRQLKEISDLGFISLVADAGGQPYFFNSQSTKKPVLHESEPVGSFRHWQAQLENVLAVSRFVVNIMRLWSDNSDKLNGTEKIKTFLLNWLSQYCQSSDNASEEEKARRPLREFHISVAEIPGKPGDYVCVLLIRPTYQLDDRLNAMRVAIYLAAPG